MASSYLPYWKRLLIAIFPLLFQSCKFGNYHWRWDRLCHCGLNHHEFYPSDERDHHGGVIDLKTGEELLPYKDNKYRIQTGESK